MERRGWAVTVTGRIDGLSVDRDAQVVAIEEVKSIHFDLELEALYRSEKLQRNLFQLLLYSLFLCEQPDFAGFTFAPQLVLIDLISGDTKLIDSMAHDGLSDTFDQVAMGVLTEQSNSRYDLTREEQDEFAAASHQKAARAAKDGIFDEEITPVLIPQRKGDPIEFREDEGIRPDTTAESLSKLKPAFAKDGTITAGTASQISDGACAVVVMSAAKAAELGITPIAEIGAHGVVAGPDATLQSQPSGAIKKACAREGIDPKDLDVVELNEAFAAVGIVSTRELGIDPSRDDFSCVGIGDMSGDVFGNGMLLSEHLRLVAAFDHRHLFLDPDPDAATSYTERRRLAQLPRSSWGDYDTGLLSEGGGVFPRTAKSITLTDEVRQVIGIDEGGRITLVEIKVSMADLRGDAKWTEYLDYCDRYFWAVPDEFGLAVFEEAHFLPDRAGLIVADRFDAAVVRDAAATPLNAARRKAETLRFARRAAQRLMWINDPNLYASQA